MVDDIDDPRRQEPAFTLGEREMLEGWLEFHRTTMLFKCEGLDDAERKRRPVPTSKLSLHGLVRHMAEVERNWFRCVLLREPEAPSIWYDPPSRTANSSHSTTQIGAATWRRGTPSARPAAPRQRHAHSMTPASVSANPVPCGGSTST